jgi:hypothetical protein
MLLACALSLALAACASSPGPGTPAAAPAATPTPAINPRAAPDEATLTLYRQWIGWARIKHPYAESEARMYAVMMCESGGRAAIVNPAGPYTGLFQYASGTWNDKWNTYRTDGMLDPKAQIFATALAWSLKMQSHWGCYKKTQ